ncbi:MAG TPA: hypothetical protein VGG39_35825 [Polyangiaceae bacterium]|jgi:hypothetical protein
MTVDLPQALQDAVLRVLDAEIASERSGTSGAGLVRRERLLRATKETLAAWRSGEIGTEDAVASLDEVVRSAT